MTRLITRVELMRRYSKPTIRTYLNSVERSPLAHAQTKCPTVHALDRRLTPKLVKELVTAYEAGTPSTQLMSTYSLGKGSVLKLLREAGVKIRS